jgi:hypothetical protein
MVQGAVLLMDGYCRSKHKRFVKATVKIKFNGLHMNENDFKVLQSIEKRYKDLLKVGVVPHTMSFREFIEEDLSIGNKTNIPEEIKVEKEYLQQTREFAELCQ